MDARVDQEFQARAKRQQAEAAAADLTLEDPVARTIAEREAKLQEPPGAVARD